MDIINQNKISEKIAFEPRLKRIRVKDRFRNQAILVPNFITMIAAFCGFLAILRSISGDFEYATKCIALAIILDGLDGQVARKLNAASDFGREFDSLSDVVAFGVAPSVLLFCWGFQPLADEFGALVSFIYLICTAIRLARFNITTSLDPKKYFDGLPSPGAAAAIAALVYFYPTALTSMPAVIFVMGYALLVAYMMVSTIPFASVKYLKITPRNQKYVLLLAGIGVALAWKFSRIFFLLGTLLYLTSGLLTLFAKKDD